MNELGKQYRLGKIDAGMDAKIKSADNAYRNAAAVAQITLEAYKINGQGDVTQTLVAVRNAVSALVDILATYTNASAEYKQLSKATKL